MSTDKQINTTLRSVEAIIKNAPKNSMMGIALTHIQAWIGICKQLKNEIAELKRQNLKLKYELEKSSFQEKKTFEQKYESLITKHRNLEIEYTAEMQIRKILEIKINKLKNKPKKNPLDNLKPKPSMTNEEIKNIKRCLESGMKFKEIRKLTGRSFGSISNVKNGKYD